MPEVNDRRSEAGPRGGRTGLVVALVILGSLLVLLAWPLRTTAQSYRTGYLQASRIALVNLLKGPVRVGIQVGHLNAQDHPEEHRDLRWNFGGHARGVDELEVNLEVADRVSKLLQQAGVQVELLPASVPALYSADAVISIHADSVEDPDRRGYKSAYFEPARNSLDPLLKEHMDREFLAGSGLADDSLNTSGSMIRYYAFNPRYHHRVSSRSPALLVEMGYISNATDLAFLQQPQRPAELIAQGVIAFLTDIQRLPPQPR